jgi:hypothetical protein
MKIDGGCHCGYIAYEAEADPAKAMICHCTDCQTLSGSAFRTVLLTSEGSFKLRSGELRQDRRKRHRPTAILLSKMWNAHLFHDSWRRPESPLPSFGYVRQRDQFTPNLQLWSRSAQHWVNDIGSIPRIEKQPAFAPSGAVGDKS